MNLAQIRNTIKSSRYEFLRNHKNLGNNIILLTLGGSYAYGMDTENSDLDIRGIALNQKEEILLGTDFNQIVDTPTDTVIYSFNKILALLAKCNPNTIEMLGCIPEHYLYKSSVGEELINNRKLFLSKICVHTFGNYAWSQLRRLQNKSSQPIMQIQKEEHILKSITNAQYELKNKYHPYTKDDIKLYIDKSNQQNYNSEIFMDINLQHYPLRDWLGMWGEMKNIIDRVLKYKLRFQYD